MPTDQQAPPTAQAPPLQQPLRPAHPDAPEQPVLVADLSTGMPTWVYPPKPADPPGPRVDPVAQRIMAAGLASPLVGWGGSMFFGAMAGATTGLGYAAVCCVSFAVIRSGGKGSGSSVNVRIDNRGR